VKLQNVIERPIAAVTEESLAELKSVRLPTPSPAPTATNHALPPSWVGRAFSSTHLKRLGLTK